MKKDYTLATILFATLAIRLLFAFGWHEIWWDSGVYIGMGKYIYSGGQLGLFEHIRPPIMPLILGAAWKLGLDPALFGRLIEIILMLGIVALTYKLSEKWWDKKTAAIASLIVAFSPIFYYLSFHQYTEIPSTFAILLALWLFTKQKHFWAGLAIGIAFLTKFYTGIFIAILLIALATSKKWKQAAITTTGFIAITAPYFAWSWIAYGSPLATILAAQEAISRALGCNVLRYKPWWQYFHWLVFSETKLYLMAIPGVIALWKKPKKLYLLSLIIPAIYLMQLHCRDYRYLTILIPFTAMLTGLGIVWVYDRLKIKKKQIFALLIILLSAWMMITCIKYYYGNELQQPDITAEEYFNYPTEDIKGEIWTSNPIIAAHSNSKLEKMYYPIYDKGVSTDFKEYLQTNHEKIGAVFLDNCGGGIICPPEEKECLKQTEQIIQELDKHFKRTLDKQTGNCWYRIWTTS